jgi:hypothetical protein
MTVSHQLSRMSAGIGQTEPINDIIQPALQQDDEVVTGDPGQAFGIGEDATELPLQHAIGVANFLLFA